MAAGTMDRRVVIERATVIEDGYGAETQSWSLLIECAASRSDVKDFERMSSDRITATLSARFVIRSTPVTRQITAQDRLLHDGHVWELLGVKEASIGRARFLELTAQRMAD